MKQFKDWYLSQALPLKVAIPFAAFALVCLIGAQFS